MIEKMNFLSITGPKEDLDRVVSTYLSKYEMHLENALSELTSVPNLTPFLDANPYKEPLAEINRFYEELDSPETTEFSPMEIEQALDTVKAIREKTIELKDQQKELEDQCASTLEPMRIIRPFQNVDIDISSLLKFEFIGHRFGRIEKQYYEKFKNYIYDNLNTVFYECEEDDEYLYGIYFAPKSEFAKVDAVYTSMHFERIFIPDRYQGTAKQAYQQLQEEYNSLMARAEETQKAYRQYLQDNAVRIVSARELLRQYADNFDVRKLAACTKGERENFYILCGWMSEADTEAFQKEIASDSSLYCLVERNQENISKVPPTKLKNPGIFKPFEMYIKMYGLPAYGEMDPTWFVALTYSFIFGAMFGDVGQGLLLTIGGFLLYRFKHMDLAGIISRAGIFSTIFGFLFGSIFGFEDIIPALWLRPREAMMNVPFLGRLNAVFIIAVGFGMCIILVCMIFNIINAHRAKDIEKTWFDTNAVAGLVFYGSLTAVLALFVTGRQLPGTIVLLIMFVVPLILIFLKEPLTNYVEKKPHLVEGGMGMFLVQGFFEMFEVLLSYFSNTLSFVRIGAFAVSHAAMMEVVLMLAGAESGNPNWIVIVLGNLFVCGLEGLIVGIQVLRLEYYEIFSRFYKGSGRSFESFGSGHKA